jgi:hypothetical protein
MCHEHRHPPCRPLSGSNTALECALFACSTGIPLICTRWSVVCRTAETQQAKAAAETAASKASSGIRALTEAHKAVRLNVDLSLITDSSSSVAAGTTGKASLASLGKGRLPPGVTPFNVPQPYHVRLTLAEWRTRQGLDQEA